MAQELLRQAMVELDAQPIRNGATLDAKGRRHRRHGGFCRRSSRTGPRGDRSERAGRSRRQTAWFPPNPGRSHKARAIELLDRGLLALDEKRFDDAEQFARQAAQLHVAWDKYDYRPENLLDEIRRQRPSVASRASVRPAADSAFDARPSDGGGCSSADGMG